MVYVVSHNPLIPLPTSIFESRRMRFLLLPFAAIALVCSVFSPAHAQALRPNPPAASEREAAIQSAIQSLPAPARLAMDAAEKQTTPVFIFIPGILGSKLSRKVAGKAVPFWGTARDFVLDDPSFRYDEADVVSAEVLDDVYVPIIGEKLDVYGQGYQAITLITGSPELVLKFPYDWRQSNVRTADDFSKWLCKTDVQSVVKNRPVVFIAHSMGGLILKYWLKNHYRSAGCDDKAGYFASYMPIYKIVFLGTPNFGAPKAVLAFSQGESLFFDEPNDDNIWKKALHWVDTHVVAGNLNHYGIYYPSTYQLLPIYGKTAPGCSLSAWDSDLDFRTATNVEAAIDLFNPRFWEALGWPRQLTPSERTEFIKTRLPKLLGDAKTFLCDVATYNVDEDFEVVHFYGMRQETPCKIKFEPPDFRGKVVDTCPGDGTVPYLIAEDVKRAKTPTSNPEPHIRQIAAPEFSAYLEWLRGQTYTKFVSAADAKAAANVLATLKYVPPVDPAATPGDAAKLTEVADMVVRKLNIDPRKQIWVPANQKEKQDASVRAGRANQMLAYANLTAANPQQKAWAFNNSAHIHLCNHNFVQSFELAKRAVDAATKVQASSPELSTDMRNLKSSAALTAAISAGRLGNSEKAEAYKTLAIKNGSKKAKSVVVPTPVSPLNQVNECRSEAG
jgi:Lecithin:cholesterol acyltransferase